MPVPDWADEDLSNDLPNFRAQGEGQDLEFMEAFPQQVRDLAKEIAAFASTNPGTILLGVSDDGSLVGLPTANAPEQRDELLRRIEGICRGTIRPAITPNVNWAVEINLNVLVIQVPKGTEPVYYSNNIPYVRHLSESRPAEPHEVIERVRTHLAAQLKQNETDPFGEFLTQLASLIIETLIFAEETEERDVNPWLDQWRSQYENAASRLREFAADEQAVEHALSEELNGLAIALDAVALFRLYMGCGPQFNALKKQAFDRLEEVKQRHVDTVPLSDASLAVVRETVGKTERQLQTLTGRMVDMVNQGHVDDVRAEASRFGFLLLRLSYYGVDLLRDGLSSDLRTIGRELHLVETMPLYLDGGHTMKAILDRITEMSERLGAVVKSLE